MDAKDLTKEPPRSPRVRIAGYVILGRVLDKCRAALLNQAGEYHFHCALDLMLFHFKRVDPAEFKCEVERGASDSEMAQWLDDHGLAKTREQIHAWSDHLEQYSLFHHSDEEKRNHFLAECQKLGLNPETTTLFEWLEADDRAEF